MSHGLSLVMFVKMVKIVLFVLFVLLVQVARPGQTKKTDKKNSLLRVFCYGIDRGRFEVGLER